MSEFSRLPVKVKVTGARGPAGLKFQTPPIPGEFIAKAPGTNNREFVSLPAATPVNAVPLTSLAAASGSALVGHGTGSVATALDTINASRGVSVLDFIPKSKWAGIKAGTNNDDLTAYFQAAAAACRRSSAAVAAQAVGTVFVPGGRYHITEVGIQGVVLRGESREGTVLRAFSAGASSRFMLDGMLTPDTVTKTTVGTGWAENLSIEGTMANGSPSGRSGLRTYGGGNYTHNLGIRNCATGFACGLPIWQTIANLFIQSCNVGFYTFHDSPGDNGTSLTVLNCWTLSCATYGFHISQLYYSSFINCVSQDAGVHNWYLEGNLNGTVACYSLQFIGCATEGHGTPFYFKRGRDITIINPRIIIPDATVDYITFDDTTGSISDFSTVSTPGAGKYHLATTNGTPYSIALINCLVTYASAVEGVIARMNSGAPGTTQNGVSGSSFMVGTHKVVGQQGVAVGDIDVTGLTGINRTIADTVNAILSRMRETTGHGLIAG